MKKIKTYDIMPKISKYLDFLKISVFIMVLCYMVSCENKITSEPFFDDIDVSISEFITNNKDTFSYFYDLMISTGMDKTMSAYNYHGSKYTLFIPTDEAFEKFIAENDDYDSFQALLDDESYAKTLIRYHLVNMGLITNDFPFGALPDTTVSGDQLTIGFSESIDSTIYMVNNYAAVTRGNIELTNGYIHIIAEVLVPIIESSYEWLRKDDRYSIFSDALELTGLNDTFIVASGDGGKYYPGYTLLVESNEVFNKIGISSVNDLIGFVSPESDDYTVFTNGLYNFMAYHILEGRYFLNDLEGQATNYNTLGTYPVALNASGLDIKINNGVAQFDTIVENNDTTIINFVKINYETSNVITKNGAVHFIENVMEVFKPARTTRTFEFYEEPLLNNARKTANTYEFDEPDDFSVIDWKGTEFLYYVKYSNSQPGLWSNDYIELEGDFSISYEIPKVLPGKYLLRVRTNGTYYQNATIEVFLDGKKIGGNIDLTSGGDASSPYTDYEIGFVNFTAYVKHTLVIRTLIPGVLTWDNVSFVPE